MKQHLPILAASLLLSGVIAATPQFTRTAKAYPAGCVTQQCREAYDAQVRATTNMQNSTAQALTLENEVAVVEQEIANLNERIAFNSALAAELQANIDANQAKLTVQQTALAKLLVNMHFSTDANAITLLAGSSSIGDYAEKQARQATAQTQIVASTEQINLIKAQLESDKAAVDLALATAEADRAAAVALQNDLNAKIIKYRNDAEAYRRDAEAERDRMAAEIAAYNSSGVAGNGTNTYPYAAQCPSINLSFLYSGGYVCQCTSYAGWKVQEYWGITISSWGNAYSWGSSAAARGYRVDNIPMPGTVAVSTAGEWGHVMWVESVNADGTINVTEYNNSYATGLVSGIYRIADFGARNNVSPSQYRYIHFD